MHDITHDWDTQRRDPLTGRIKSVPRYEVRVDGEAFKHACTLKRARIIVRKLRAGNFEDNPGFSGPLGGRKVSIHDRPH